jgi:vanillate O-demethylase ferredoxin subunit
MTSLDLRIASITRLTDRIAEFDLTGADDVRLPEWQPGAHIRVALPDGGDRAYSLIRFPGEAQVGYRIAVQREDDGKGGSKFMHGLAVGDMLSVTPPKCDFPLANAPALLLAGGIGITPMISMALALQEAGTPFDLHYCGRSRGVMAYVDALQNTLGGALHIHCDDDPATAPDLTALVGGLSPDRHLYICGPRGMIDAARAQAEAAGIAPDRVHVELFDNASAGGDDSAFEVELSSTGQVFTIPPDRTIIEVLEEAGFDLVYDCQRGDCGICQTDVISGTPDHRDVVLTEAERAGGNVMQICVSRAKSPRLVLDL